MRLPSGLTFGLDGAARPGHLRAAVQGSAPPPRKGPRDERGASPRAVFALPRPWTASPSLSPWPRCRCNHAPGPGLPGLPLLPHTARNALGRAAHSADTVSIPARYSRARTRPPTPGRSLRSSSSSRPGSASSTVSPSGLSIAEATFASQRFDATPIEHVTRGPTASRSRALMRRPTSSAPSRAPRTQHDLRDVVPRTVGQGAHTPDLERPRVRRLHPLRRRLGTPTAGYSMTGIFASQSSFKPGSRMN